MPSFSKLSVMNDDPCTYEKTYTIPETSFFDTDVWSPRGRWRRDEWLRTPSTPVKA